MPTIFPLDATAQIITAEPEGERVVTNGGPSTVYYSTVRTVSSSSYDGTLSAGQSVKIFSPRWFVSPSQARIVVNEYSPVESLLDELGAVSAPVTRDGISDSYSILQATLNQTSTAGGTVTLAGGTYAISGLLSVPSNVNLVGQGSTATIIKATTASAGIVYGPDIGGTTQRNQRQAGWQFDGNLISTVGLRANTTPAVWEDIVITRVNGDGFRQLGQNNLHLNVNSGDNAGSNLVLDNGTGDNEFIRCEFNAAGKYAVEFASSADSTAGAYVIPTLNIFWGGILERAGSPSFPSVNGGVGLGSVHCLAGSFNHFVRTEIVYQNGARPAVYIEPNTRSAHSGDANGRWYFDSCQFVGVGGGVSTSAAIEANHVSGGVAGGFNADAAVVLMGHNVFSGYLEAIKWGTSTPIYTISGEPILYTCPTEFLTNGTGAWASLTRYGGSAQFFPDDISVTRDAYIGDYAQFVNTSDTSVFAAGRFRIYSRDSSGIPEAVLGFPDGSKTVIGRQADYMDPWRVEINPFTTPSSTVGAWTNVQSGSALMGGYRQSAGAQNNEITWDVVIPAGTWELTVIYAKSSNSGIITPTVAGADQATYDAYSAGGTFDNVYTATGITVSTAGKKTVKLKATSKNGSSSNYYVLVQWVSLRRTA